MPLSFTFSPVEEDPVVVFFQVLIVGAVLAVFVAIFVLIVGVIFWPEQTTHFLNTGNFDYVPIENNKKTDEELK